MTESKFYRISGASTQNRGVVPDVAFPSVYNPEDIGESALDYALEWDQISPVRHRVYGDFSEVVPYINSRSLERRKINPDFISLKERVIFSNQNRANTKVSLNEVDRKTKRLDREARALEIENNRRRQKGLKKIDNINELDQNEDTENSLDDDAGVDFFLQEAGNILADLIHFSSDKMEKSTTSELALKNRHAAQKR